MNKKKRYIPPKIKVKKVKLSFFMQNVSWLDQFNIIGNVYAQSGCSGGGGDGGYGCMCGECGQSTSDCGACTCSM